MVLWTIHERRGDQPTFTPVYPTKPWQGQTTFWIRLRYSESSESGVGIGIGGHNTYIDKMGGLWPSPPMSCPSGFDMACMSEDEMAQMAGFPSRKCDETTATGGTPRFDL